MRSAGQFSIKVKALKNESKKQTLEGQQRKNDIFKAKKIKKSVSQSDRTGVMSASLAQLASAAPSHSPPELSQQRLLKDEKHTAFHMILSMFSTMTSTVE